MSFTVTSKIDSRVAHLTLSGRLDANTAPTLSISAPASPVVETPMDVTFTVSDPSTPDQVAGFTVVVNWGDGTPPETLSGTSPLTASHTYIWIMLSKPNVLIGSNVGSCCEPYTPRATDTAAPLTIATSSTRVASRPMVVLIF